MQQPLVIDSARLTQIEYPINKRDKIKHMVSMRQHMHELQAKRDAQRQEGIVSAAGSAGSSGAAGADASIAAAVGRNAGVTGGVS